MSNEAWKAIHGNLSISQESLWALISFDNIQQNKLIYIAIGIGILSIIISATIGIICIRNQRKIKKMLRELKEVQENKDKDVR